MRAMYILAILCVLPLARKRSDSYGSRVCAAMSFAVRAAASKMDRKATDMDVRATPTFIVNGKYKMLPQGFRDSDDFAADFSKLAGYLLNKS